MYMKWCRHVKYLLFPKMVNEKSRYVPVTGELPWYFEGLDKKYTYCNVYQECYGTFFKIGNHKFYEQRICLSTLYANKLCKNIMIKPIFHSPLRRSLFLHSYGVFKRIVSMSRHNLQYYGQNISFSRYYK